MMLLHNLIFRSADSGADRLALFAAREQSTYGELADSVLRVASGFLALGMERGDRVAIFLPKSIETVAAMFGASAAGGVFVPINPVQKPAQVGHILRDSGARVLVTSVARLEAVGGELESCP